MATYVIGDVHNSLIKLDGPPSGRLACICLENGARFYS